jgi:purine-binding chemotaxis protein CheW
MEAATKIDGAQYLTFTLNDEQFGVDIAKVREVLEFTSATKVPRTPDFMRGVINLRGSVVPVLDLKMKFGMGQTDKDIDTCVIITEIDVGGELIVIGAMADAVQEVFDIDADQIEPPPKIGSGLDTEFIYGMGKRGDEFLILLDIDRVFSAAEVAAVSET